MNLYSTQYNRYIYSIMCNICTCLHVRPATIASHLTHSAQIISQSRYDVYKRRVVHCALLMDHAPAMS